ncbi:uncharacterized protein LOC144358482, partial [Saccoglossus kowalevskii]
EATEFTCSTTNGNPAAELTWTIGGKDITEYSTYTTQVSDNNDKLHNSMSVLIYAFKASNNGEELICTAFQHERLTTRSAHIILNVLHPPVIHVIEIVDWDDHSVTVKCVDTANPDSHRYEWEADGDQTGDTEDDNTWEFTDTDNDCKENVKCTATNSEGSVSYEQEVTWSASDVPSLHVYCIVYIMMNYIIMF